MKKIVATSSALLVTLFTLSAFAQESAGAASNAFDAQSASAIGAGLAIGLGALGVAGLGVAIAGFVARPAASPSRPEAGRLVRRAALHVNGAGVAVEGAF